MLGILHLRKFRQWNKQCFCLVHSAKNLHRVLHKREHQCYIYVYINLQVLDEIMHKYLGTRKKQKINT